MFGVCMDILVQFGVVSEEIVCEMVVGVIENFSVDWVILIIGIVGLGGGLFFKLVGIVCFGWCCCGGMFGSEIRFFFGECRSIW